MKEAPALDTLTTADTHACWQLSQALRWPHREADWQAFITWAQAHGTALAVRAEGRLIGCGLAWQWGERHGSIGMVIVDNAWQRRGIGKRLFGSLLQALDGRSITLQATAQGRPLYESLGFVAIGHARQFHGHWQPVAADAEPTAPLTRLLQPADMPALLAFDQRERGLERAWLLQDMLTRMDTDERCAVSLDKHGRLCGYGLLRRFGRGWVVGPLLADSAPRAMALVQLLTRERTGDFVRIDLAAGTRAFPAEALQNGNGERASHESDGNRESRDADILAHWLQAQGLALVDEPTTMVRPAPGQPQGQADTAFPPPASATICALAAQALG